MRSRGRDIEVFRRFEKVIYPSLFDEKEVYMQQFSQVGI